MDTFRENRGFGYRSAIMKTAMSEEGFDKKLESSRLMYDGRMVLWSSDELLREKMQREADRRLGSRYDLSETRCTETSSSTKKPRISRRELLLVTSKKAKALAAIKRQR
ncbi:unnamed protein product [Toxocara canis]|uniref:DUF1977 family protein n=1 Tax=Toxocara canis TaxID=6265 RepID=A0A183V8S1_TOXCA|nr:unnamed protein product [Toxocara canis]